MKNKVSIAVVGGGISGLVAAYRLSQEGFKVNLFEPKELGGLLSTFPIGANRLEKFYHHIFPHNKNTLSLLSELGLKEKVQFTNTKIGLFTGRKTIPFSTIINFFNFPPLDFKQKIRLGINTIRLKHQKWQKLIKYPITKFLPEYLGNHAYKIIWQPLVEKKFGSYTDTVMMPWLWARITQRSKKLGYLNGSFQCLIDRLAEKLSENGVRIRGSAVDDMAIKDQCIILKAGGKNHIFTHVLFATPLPVFKKIASKVLSPDFVKQQLSIRYIKAQCLILALKHPLTQYYWININDPKSKFIALVEHTNFRSVDDYNGQHLVYLSQYCPPGNGPYPKNKEEILNTAIPLLKKINKNFSPNWIKSSHLFSSQFTQHVADKQYYTHLPQIETPLKNVYNISIAHIYPDDRGIEKAIELAEQAASLIIRS
ncbi:MAG: FAD-dependent oxidoreductase [bacterium]|nr:FAD-dependent oxidoreductase [bacterium]